MVEQKEAAAIDDMASPTADFRQPYFPQADALYDDSIDSVAASRIAPRPLPITLYDDDSSTIPLRRFEQTLHDANYGSLSMTPANGSHAAKIPPEPRQLIDPYLIPSLTVNERVRLTSFWYHTRGLAQDKDFLESLQQKLGLVHEFIGWDIAIIGLVGEDVFTRLAAVGAPLAGIPRRESTCAHTINQPAGTVFMLPDMTGDWRFRQSPHVVESSLRSYAGAQLRCRAQGGQEIALGSLCVGSLNQRKPLTASQQAALVKFADMLASEIISRSANERKSKRAHMSELLANSHTLPQRDVRKYILSIVRQMYKDAHVDTQTISIDKSAIQLPSHEPVPLETFHDGLWEDTELIEHIITTQNHHELKSDHSLRAIAHICTAGSKLEYLVVSNNHPHSVYDNFDSWFVERCAQRLRESDTELKLAIALTAKDDFLRGITHQLRTPIHGVLGACELLHEELTSANLHDLTNRSSAANNKANGHLTTPSAVLDTIRDSGRELMYTVNNLIRLNRWTETLDSPARIPRLSTYNQIEADILHELDQMLPAHLLSRTSIFFLNLLSNDDALVVIDRALLKECLQALVLNAVIYTQEGSVAIIVSATEDYSRLVFDVIDTGCGIAAQHRDRIFDAYTKVDTHTRGVGLGLTLARKMAASMGGSVVLVESSQDPKDHGSHFRAEFLKPGFACPLIRNPPLTDSLRYMPRSFHVLTGNDDRCDLVLHMSRYLSNQGFKVSDTPENSFILATFYPGVDEFRTIVESIAPGQAALCLKPAETPTASVHGNERVRVFSGPFLSARLESILHDIDAVYQRIDSEKAVEEDPNVEKAEKASLHSRTLSSTTSHGQTFADKQPKALLLVDDNVVNLRIMRMYCEKRSIPYVTAMDGNEAVAQYKNALAEDPREPINLILMDQQMPHMDGVQATRIIREMEKQYAVPLSSIFMVTGQDSVSDKTASFAAGANEFYVKPLSLRVLDFGITEYFPAFSAETRLVARSSSTGGGGQPLLPPQIRIDSHNSESVTAVGGGGVKTLAMRPAATRGA